jgi:putative hydrolase of the HAD superfamily
VALRAVTLDAAGTLFQVAEPVGSTYARFARAHGIAADPAAVERGFRTAFAAAPPLAFPGASPSRLADHERAWWYTIVRSAFGRAATTTGFDEWFDAVFAYYTTADAWRVPPDVRPALARLRAAALRIGVVSNFDGRLPVILAALGLAPLVDRVVWSSRVGAAKPDPAIFHAAVAALGVAPAEALHVGDDPRADVEGARAAGLRALRIDRTARSGAADAPLRSLADLPAAVDASAQA